LEADLGIIATEQNIELPINRRQCVFLYPSLQQAATEIYSATELSPNDRIVVVDRCLLDQKSYVGEFDLISDAIDLQFMSEPDEAIISESYEDALIQYAASLTEVDSFESEDQIHREFIHPEVVVENTIDSSAIVDVF